MVICSSASALAPPPLPDFVSRPGGDQPSLLERHVLELPHQLCALAVAGFVFEQDSTWFTAGFFLFFFLFRGVGGNGTGEFPPAEIGV